VRAREGTQEEDEYEEEEEEEYEEENEDKKKEDEEEVYEDKDYGEDEEGKSGDDGPRDALPPGHLQRRLQERRRSDDEAETRSRGASGVSDGSEEASERPAMVLADGDDAGSSAHRARVPRTSGAAGGKEKSQARRTSREPPPPRTLPPPPVPPFAPPFVNGEATPFYLAERGACAAMADEMPAPPSLVVLLRDPVDRAYSEYQMKVIAPQERSLAGRV
jgi:hypothetical protein